MTNLSQLQAMMQEHGLSRLQVSQLLGVRKSAVDSWFFSPETQGYRSMPDQSLSLLQYRLTKFVEVVCRECNGSSYLADDIDCPNCGGTGTIYKLTNITTGE